MLIKGDLVHCPSLGEVAIMRNYLLRVDSRGYVDHLAHASHADSLSILMHEDPIIIPQGSFLLPTFCDLHLHAPQFMYQGTGLHLPLMEWLNEYAFKAEESLDSKPQLAESVYRRLAARLIEHGTGAVLLFGTIKAETNLILARVMREAGIRAFVGKLSMDISSRPTYVEPSTNASLEAARSFCDRCLDVSASLPAHERLVEPVITPRFIPTCSNELLAGLGLLSAEKDLRIQSHMAEAHDQIQHVLSERKVDDMDLFAQSNLLTPRTVQAHCTFLAPPTLARLAKTGTAVAHCPLSNAYFSAQPFRLREALDVGVRVGLGTDIAGGYSIDIMNAMRQSVAVSRMREGARISGHYQAAGDHTEQEDKVLSVNWKEALYLATKGGAEALNLAMGSGSFVVGAPFDAQCIQVFDAATGEGTGGLDFFQDPRPDGLTLETLEKWWCIGDLRNRKEMWVQGRTISRH
ncbi:Metallo-dependent hydrolase [Lentinus tigrinus ALCF2SS1-7]|uniref:Metallo-dependent hydrolase n=1 Tax=Lentinus tigrinus ALCF2SS1-6 TaxID=1328759 RepID=A0A5C2SET1_9APHY|nr:Metallo-dependent hydrolase [Lentinus tigrinus ALCF2SS1-6]RPD77898.1 Metallo-dependent hydrolase [Lentinus tigrinus ALCF2SS1-7]